MACARTGGVHDCPFGHEPHVLDAEWMGNCCDNAETETVFNAIRAGLIWWGLRPTRGGSVRPDMALAPRVHQSRNQSRLGVR